jgi:ferredoxin
MIIRVSTEKCQGHGRCYALAPEIFRADANGHIEPGNINVPSGSEAAATRAAKACPERALTIE